MIVIKFFYIFSQLINHAFQFSPLIILYLVLLNLQYKKIKSISIENNKNPYIYILLYLDTWEPLNNLTTVKDMIEEFNKRYTSKKKAKRSENSKEVEVFSELEEEEESSSRTQPPPPKTSKKQVKPQAKTKVNPSNPQPQRALRKKEVYEISSSQNENESQEESGKLSEIPEKQDRTQKKKVIPKKALKPTKNNESEEKPDSKSLKKNNLKRRTNLTSPPLEKKVIKSTNDKDEEEEEVKKNGKDKFLEESKVNKKVAKKIIEKEGRKKEDETKNGSELKETVEKKLDMIKKTKSTGHFDYGDKAIRIITAKPGKDEIVCAIEWAARKNGFVPIVSHISNTVIKEKDPLLLIKFYESKLKFDRGSDKEKENINLKGKFFFYIHF